MIRFKINKEQRNKLFNSLYHRICKSRKTGYKYKIVDANYRKNEIWIRFYNYFTEKYEWHPLDGFSLMNKNLLIKMEIKVI